MGTNAESLASELGPILSAQGLALYDVELARSLVRVVVTSAGGISLEQLASANHAVSGYLDEHEPFKGRYTLEVTSPGVERSLRTPAHFSGAIGESVRIKTIPDSVSDRRVEGVLTSADEHGIAVTAATGEVQSLAYDQIDKARTHFEWGSTAKLSPSRAGSPRGQRRAPEIVRERIITP
jgi:ribosome maturation factor RimP